MASIKVSIIFPNHNGSFFILNRLLVSLNNQKIPNIEIILIDNNSNNNALQRIKEKYPRIVIIKNSENYGFSKSINQGVKKATGKYVFITNNDVVLEKKCLHNLISYMKIHANTGVVGPISFTDKTHKHLDIGVLKYFITTGLFSTHLCTQPTDSDWVAGSGMLLKKSIFEKINGFDNDFFFYYEDLDFCLRIKKKGLRVITIPKATILHKRGSTAHLKRNHFFRFYHLHKSRQILLAKHGNFVQLIVGTFLQLFVFSLYHGIILRDGSNLPLLNATSTNIHSWINNKFLHNHGSLTHDKKQTKCRNIS